jgi:hypothetical protein
MTHNPERSAWKGRSYRKGGERVRDLRDRARSADSLALDILLADIPEETRQRQLGALAKRVRQATGSECPSCGSTGGLEDNGAHGSELVHLCTACGHQWGPGAEV